MDANRQLLHDRDFDEWYVTDERHDEICTLLTRYLKVLGLSRYVTHLADRVWLPTRDVDCRSL